MRKKAGSKKDRASIITTINTSGGDFHIPPNSSIKGMVEEGGERIKSFRRGAFFQREGQPKDRREKGVLYLTSRATIF